MLRIIRKIENHRNNCNGLIVRLFHDLHEEGDVDVPNKARFVVCGSGLAGSR
jgi:hypothetical protein